MICIQDKAGSSYKASSWSKCNRTYRQSSATQPNKCLPTTVTQSRQLRMTRSGDLINTGGHPRSRFVPRSRPPACANIVLPVWNDYLELDA